MLPAVLLKEPYSLPQEWGSSPPGRDPYTQPDGGHIQGAPWNADTRGDFFVGADYQGYGGPEASFVSLGQPTFWSSYTGLVPSQPMIHGYDGQLQETTLAELRAGSTIGFPLHGQTEPGFDPTLIEITNQPGFDIGWQLQWTDGQRMLFSEPPDYSSQTQGIPAAGYP